MPNKEILLVEKEEDGTRIKLLVFRTDGSVTFGVNAAPFGTLASIPVGSEVHKKLLTSVEVFLEEHKRENFYLNVSSTGKVSNLGDTTLGFTIPLTYKELTQLKKVLSD